MNHLSLSTTGIAGRWLAAGLGTAAAAGLATHASTKGDILIGTAGRFLQRQRYIAAQISTFPGTSPATATPSAEQIAEHATTEQVTDRIKDIFDIIELVNTVNTGMPVLVIALAFLAITENLVGLRGFFELGDRVFIIPIAVGMKLDR